MNRTDSIAGAWQVTRIEYLFEGNASVIDPALPGLFIFTDDHYSMTWQPGNEKQADYADLWHPTDAEKGQSYDAIVTNAGRFELADDHLTTYVEVAKTPAFVGGLARYRCEIDDHSMKLEIVDNVAHDHTRDTAYLKFKTTLYLTRV